MTGHTPITADIRDSYAADIAHSGTYAEKAKDFDRWFSSEIASAEARGYFKSVQDAYNNRMRLEEEQ